MKKLWVLLIVTWLSHPLLYSQSFSPGFISITTEDGLPSNVVKQTLQDSRGYLWIATYNGLCRYDGYSFKVYLNGAGEESGNIPHSPITALFEDRDNFLWVGTFSGSIYRYEPSIDNFISYTNQDFINGSPLQDIIMEISEDDSKRIWIAASNAIYCLPNKDIDSIVLLKDYRKEWEKKGKHFRISQILHNESEKWLLVSGLGLKRIQVGRNLKISEPVFFDSLNIPPPFHYPIRVIDKSDSLLIAYISGIVTLNKQSLQMGSSCIIPDFCLQPSSEMTINSILIYKNEVWISAKSAGLYYFNRVTGVKEHYTASSNDNYALLDNNINHLYRDNAGNIWISTSRGLNKLNRNGKVFQHLVIPEDIIHNENTIGARCLFQAKDGSIWVGTKGSGLLGVNKNGEIDQYLQEDWRDEHNRNFVQDIAETPTSDFWVATYRGLALFSRKTGQFKSIDVTDGRVPTYYQFCWGLHYDGKRFLYIGMLGQGLFRYDVTTNISTHIQFVEERDTISHIDVYKIEELHDRRLLIGTNQGAWMYDVTSGRAYVSDRVPLNSESGFNTIIWDFYQADSHTLWMSSTNMGLFELSLNNGVVRQYGIAAGLPNLTLSAIIGKKTGKLWISTTEGLCLFNMKNKRVENSYSHPDGLPSKNFFYGSVLLVEGGTVYFGYDRGVIRFKPNNLTSSSYSPKTVITSVEADYIFRPDASATGSLEIGHDENSVLISFASLDYTSPSKNRFRYRLQGLDHDWIESNGSYNKVNYTGLPPGKYKFMVQGTNSNGVWNGSVATLSLSVKPAFWQTTFFKVSMALLGLGLFSVLGGMFLYSQNEKRKVLKAELISLRSRLNPHFIFNSLNSLQHFILQRKEEDALNYLSDFSSLMRKILEYSGRSSINLQEEKEFLLLYLGMEASRNDTPFEYFIYISPELEANTYLPPMLVQPFIENAIVHGLIGKLPNGKVCTYFKKEGNILKCIIEDNGIGRMMALKNKQSKTTSFSTKAISESFYKWRKYGNARPNVKIDDLYNEDGQPSGTRVVIDLPLITS